MRQLTMTVRSDDRWGGQVFILGVGAQFRLSRDFADSCRT
jgi:hypothetical protein